MKQEGVNSESLLNTSSLYGFFINPYIHLSCLSLVNLMTTRRTWTERFILNFKNGLNIKACNKKLGLDFPPLLNASLKRI